MRLGKVAFGATLFTIIFLFSSAGYARTRLQHFDELKGSEGEGNIREPYRKIFKIISKITPGRRQRFMEGSKRALSGDNTIFPLPRVLDESEYSFLAEGVRQRGQALLAFLKDHYSGEKRYLKKRIIPRTVINRILGRSGEKKWETLLPPELLHFWYGPDIIRGSGGSFYVIEDNLGYLGGMGDLIKARDEMHRRFPAYGRHIDSPDPRSFYEDMAVYYRQKAQEYRGVPVVLQYANSLASDNEDKRIKKIFESLGIEVVAFNPLNTRDSRFKKRLTVLEDGVYLESCQADGSWVRKKAGFIILNIDFPDLDSGHYAMRADRILKEARELLSDINLSPLHHRNLQKLLSMQDSTKRNLYLLEKYIRRKLKYQNTLDCHVGIPGLIDAFLAGKVGLSHTPGVEFLNDKEFYIFVEEFIRFYLKEEPLIKNVPTSVFTIFEDEGQVLFDEFSFERVFKNIDKYVVKKVDGLGGKEVWVGPFLKEEDLPLLKELIKNDFKNYIFQDYIPLSVLDDHIVDLRLLSAVTPRDIIIASVPWGRAVSQKGDGKVNLSASGSETVVLIDRTGRRATCRELMKQLVR